MSTLTHKERLRLAKEKKNRDEFETMRKAALAASIS